MNIVKQNAAVLCSLLLLLFAAVDTTAHADAPWPNNLLIMADDEPAAPLQKQKATEHSAQTAEPFTIAVLPDTQYYCDCRLKLSAKWGDGDLRRYFFKQTEWVRDNQQRLNIKFLVHEGDIVQADAPEEWAIAKEAMSVLDGKVPYCMCLGNHDMGFEKSDNKYGGNIGVNRTTHFNTYFPRAKFAKRHEFGGTFDPDRHDNSWYHFEAAGMKFLIVALEYHPRDEVLDWANGIVAEHPEHRAIVLTHSYLRGNKTRTTNKLELKGNNGEQMWQKFVRKHKNMFMVLCGHFSGEAVLTSAGDHGNQVHQVLCDYQEMNNGGESWLRYMVFQPDANKIGIHTYNPALDKFKKGPSSRFDLDYPMAQPFVPAPGLTRPGDANAAATASEQPAASSDKESKQDSKPFSLIVLPDTQGYADVRHKETQKHWPDLGDQRSCFFKQTEWIKDNQKKMNTAMVVHVGDITQTDHEEEWKIADAAFKTIDGHVPYILCSGNHDMGYSPQHRKTSYSRASHFSSYFPPSRFTNNPLYDSHFGETKNLHFHEERKIENYYLLLNEGGMKFLILTLEFKPRDQTLTWANTVVAEHPDHRIIVVTHNYLTSEQGQRSGDDTYSVKGHSGESIWENFVSRHKNIFLVLSGHARENQLTSQGKHGNTVHQVQADYWYFDIPRIKAGSGFLRIMTFHPDKNLIEVQTYSPVLDEFLTRTKSKFSLDYTMSGSAEQDGAEQDGAEEDGAEQDCAEQDGAEQDGAEQDGADQPAIDPDSPAAESTQFLGAANGFEKKAIKALADRVRRHVNSQPLRFPNQHWVRGAYYAGLMAMYESTSDRAYLDDCMKWGKQVSWRIKEQGGGPYESGAYPLICGQIWYGCYRAENDEMMMRPTLAFLEDPKVENPLSAPGKWYLENTGHRFVDGLFTAAPTLAMLYQITGEEKYVEWMDAHFWDVHGKIFDHDAGLFYRDARSKPRKTKNGKKVLWSRGNGWAFGGLTRILKYLPAEHPSYPKYKSLYMKMAESLAKRQQADGFWRSNLDDPEQYPMKESSGTGFFTYGITWGINNGILNRERFLPVAMKAWAALASVVNEDGKVGWSQPAGGGPGKVAEADTSKFGTGIFLLAASEMFLLTQNPDAPNIVLIMSDDMGFSDIGCYGSEINTPNLDRLAKHGVRFSQFYNAARCCPTRAALLSGVYQHQAGIGLMTGDKKLPGYRGELGRNVVSIAEALSTAGYRRYMAGKWHVTKHVSPDGPKDNWPMQRGFEKFYGTITGAGSFYDPATLCRGNTYITPVNDPKYKPETYYYTDAISDNAVTFLKQHADESPDKPFFLYTAYTTAHWPMHALPQDIAKYKGKYDKGFTPIREARLAKMKSLGLVTTDTKLSPQSDSWEEVADKPWEARNMEVYAAMIDSMDQGIGRIVAELKRQGELDNTLILFLQDNGGCAEGYGRYTPKNGYAANLKPMGPDDLQTKIWPAMQTRDGRPLKSGPGVMAGPQDTFVGYGRGWANVSNTPFREYKHFAHEGGISTPLIVHWPNGIDPSRNGKLEHQPGHVIDIMATCADVAGGAYPKKFGEHGIIPVEGVSLRPAFSGKSLERSDALYFEHHLNCAIRDGDWKLVCKGKDGLAVKQFDWELYNVKSDRAELQNVADKNPEKVEELLAKWEKWAVRAKVQPWPYKTK